MEFERHAVQNAIEMKTLLPADVKQ